MPSKQQPGLSTKWTSVHDVESCKMQAKQDYSTATLHMVSLLQESTVQRLFRNECNTTFIKKKKNHFFMSLGIRKKAEIHRLSTPGAPKAMFVH